MSRVGNTYTRHFQLETKQHELLGVDLGEGAPRRGIIMGLILYVLWDGALLLLLGFPSPVTATFYILPPLFFTYYGMQRSTRADRRWNVTMWSLTARYLIVGHRPIVCGGRRAASRSEWISRRDRWGTRIKLLADSPLGGPLERWLGTEGEPTGAGAPLLLGARPRLYGPDAVAAAYGRKALKGEK